MSEVKKCPKCGGQVIEVLCYQCEKCGDVSYGTNTENQKFERNSLLQHFSSKSTNQTALLLGFAIALVSFSQTTQYVGRWPSLLRNLYYLLFPTAFSYLFIRSLGRLFVWGRLADAILKVRMLEEEEIMKRHAYEKSTIVPTYYVRLYDACHDKLKSMNRIFFWVGEWTREPRNYFLFLSLLSLLAIAVFILTETSLIFNIACIFLGGMILLIGIIRYKQRTHNMTKKGIAVTITKDLLKWIDGKVKDTTFANRSHAVERALTLLRQAQSEKKE